VHEGLRLGIIDGTGLSASVTRVTASVVGGVGREGTSGAQGLYVELGVFPVLGGEICAQSNLFVRLDDFLGIKTGKTRVQGKGPVGWAVIVHVTFGAEDGEFKFRMEVKRRYADRPRGTGSALERCRCI